MLAEIIQTPPPRAIDESWSILTDRGECMPVTRRIGERLTARAAAAFAGREVELRLLAECREDEGPVVSWFHGPAGMGKTALLQEFSARAVAAGDQIIRLDCRLIEPTPECFLSALAQVLNRPVETVEAAAEALSSPGLFVLDGYEVFRLLDAWMCQVFVPALRETVRVVICGRYPPGPNWLTALEWRGLVRVVPLLPLSELESVTLLERLGAPEDEAASIFRFTGGHPMALVLAAGAKSQRAWKADPVDSQTMMWQLTQLYLAEVEDASLHRAVEAAAVVRRTTHSLLAAMVPEFYSRQLYEDLATLTIVEATSEGLMIPQQVQEAVASWLRSSDPHRASRYRRAAWKQIRAEREQADRRDLWRYTADMLYLLENPGLRASFFPSGAQSLAVERARPGDRDAILTIVQAHEGERSAVAIAAWWREVPDCFSVMRDARGEVAGFYLAKDLRALRGRLSDSDPALSLLRRHLRENPLAGEETALFLRCWLSRSAGRAPSAVQAACWLDVKRSHMAMRPGIRRCYGAISDIATFAPMLEPLGFRVLPDGPVSIDGVPHHLTMLDFGPGSFDGWLGELVAEELGLQPEEILDTVARELVDLQERVGLTALEFGVLRCLRLSEGKAVTRAQLLEQVWQQRAGSGSNVVDVVVRSLRRKLGSRAWMLGTVRGVGYRFRSNRQGGT